MLIVEFTDNEERLYQQSVEWISTKNQGNAGGDPMSLRDMVLEYTADHYHTDPEYLWKSFPDYAVLRHSDNKKWYALIMAVPRKKLGFSDDGFTDVLNVKCPPEMIGPLLSIKGILPAYHMHKGTWLSVLLDGSAEPGIICSLLDTSFCATASRATLKSGRYLPAGEWIIPANPKVFDLEKAFAKSPVITWHQKNHFNAGDTIYIYMAAPIYSVLYKCQVLETDIPDDPSGKAPTADRHMRIRLEGRYAPGELSREILKQHGVLAVRSPRHMPPSLSRFIKQLEGMDQ